MKQTVTRNGVGAWTTGSTTGEGRRDACVHRRPPCRPELLHARAFRSSRRTPRFCRSTSPSHESPRSGEGGLGRTSSTVSVSIFRSNASGHRQVRYVGEPVALVVAETEEAAEEGMLKVAAKYKDLPPIFDPVKAATDNSVLVHPELETYDHVPFITPFPGTNIANWFRIRRGDVDKAFAEAEYVVEEAVNCPQIAHGFLEPHCCICKRRRPRHLTIWVRRQSAFALREIVAKGLDYPLNKIRVIAPPIGGGFGGKAGMTVEALCSQGDGPDTRAAREALHSARGGHAHLLVRQAYVSKVKLAIAKRERSPRSRTHLLRHRHLRRVRCEPLRSAGYSSTGCYYVPNVWTDSTPCTRTSPSGAPTAVSGSPS